MRYIAIISKDPRSAWGVHFPDLPGCTSAGDSMEEAVENAGKALRLWAEGEPELPKASTLDDLRKLSEVRADLAAGGMAVYVPLITAGRKQRYNVMLDPTLVAGVDRAAKSAGVSRSDFIAQAATSSLVKQAGAVVIARGNGAAVGRRTRRSAKGPSTNRSPKQAKRA